MGDNPIIDYSLLLKNQGGERNIATNLKIADFESVADSKSLAKLQGQKFTIVKIEDSDYQKGATITKGVKVTTKESFDIDGTKQNKFHSTRKAIVNKLNNEKLRTKVNHGEPLGPVYCILVKAKQGGDDYYELKDG